MNENTSTVIAIAIGAGALLAVLALVQSCIRSELAAKAACYEANKHRTGSEVTLMCGKTTTTGESR